MLVDDLEQYNNEKTDVVVVSRAGSDEPDSAPSAADRRFSLSCFAPPPETHPLPHAWPDAPHGPGQLGYDREDGPELSDVRGACAVMAWRCVYEPLS